MKTKKIEKSPEQYKSELFFHRDKKTLEAFWPVYTQMSKFYKKNLKCKDWKLDPSSDFAQLIAMMNEAFYKLGLPISKPKK